MFIYNKIQLKLLEIMDYFLYERCKRCDEIICDSICDFCGQIN